MHKRSPPANMSTLLISVSSTTKFCIFPWGSKLDLQTLAQSRSCPSCLLFLCFCLAPTWLLSGNRAERRALSLERGWPDFISLYREEVNPKRQVFVFFPRLRNSQSPVSPNLHLLVHSNFNSYPILWKLLAQRQRNFLVSQYIYNRLRMAEMETGQYRVGQGRCQLPLTIREQYALIQYIHLVVLFSFIQCTNPLS